MRKEDFYYDLPEKLIAQHPLKERAMSRLLCLDGQTGEIQHNIFSDIPAFLKQGDCLVVNNTKVIPARLLGFRKDTASPVEVLLLKRLYKDEWEVIVRPGKKMRVGNTAEFIPGILEGSIIAVKNDGNRIIRFSYNGIWEEILEKAGQIPLPPYITEKLTKDDKDRYQTVYAKFEGSSAAPTAGLHFTNELLDQIRQMGVKIAEVTLHVGLGTFRPVKESDITKHLMHSEYYEINKNTADLINQTKQSGGRIIAVGTTSCRVLESVASAHGKVVDASGKTDIFIYPGYKFKILDGLITNFHLPESTLLMLVSAFSGIENIKNAYNEAIKKEYRFFSFGDAMYLTRKNQGDY